MNEKLAAPCQWCGYNGLKYWQARTHMPSCPWFVVGGEAERNHLLFSMRVIPPPQDKVVEAVRTDLLERSRVGIRKYGVTLERTDLSTEQWLEHAYTEALDFANYLKRLIMGLRGEL